MNRLVESHDLFVLHYLVRWRRPWLWLMLSMSMSMMGMGMGMVVMVEGCGVAADGGVPAGSTPPRFDKRSHIRWLAPIGLGWVQLARLQKLRLLYESGRSGTKVSGQATDGETTPVPFIFGSTEKRISRAIALKVYVFSPSHLTRCLDFAVSLRLTATFNLDTYLVAACPRTPRHSQQQTLALLPRLLSGKYIGLTLPPYQQGVHSNNRHSIQMGHSTGGEEAPGGQARKGH